MDSPRGTASARGTRKIVIAIDGPAGSGKSTLTALLARKYGYTNIETGAMYRALALKAIQNGIALNGAHADADADGNALAALAPQSRIELPPRPAGKRVRL